MSRSSTAIRVQVLGELRVRRGTELLDLGPAKQRAVFAALALGAGSAVSTLQLREAVWGVVQPRSAQQLVHTYVARLRQILEPGLPPHGRVSVIASDSAGYRLLLGTDQLDVTRFHARHGEARRLLADNDAARAFQLLGAALGQWQDPALADLLALVRTPESVEALRRAWIEAALTYVSIGVDNGQGTRVLDVARHLADAEPMHEEVQARYLTALEQSGRRAAAIAHFHGVRARLGEELGVAPGPQLAGAYRKLIGTRQEAAPPARRVRARAPWRGPGPVPGRLVGRDADLAALTGMLTRERMVTVTGPPGCGKSALAMQAAHRMREDFPDGVLVVEASELPGEAELLASLSQVAGAGGDPAAVLGDRETLVVLDNVEHLVGAGAHLADEIVRSCGRVSLLITSRELLGLPYETVWRLGPLPAGGPDGAADLFALRAAQVSPGFARTADNADTVTAVCERLDCLPLAVELAAACLAFDTLDGVAARVAHPLREINPPRRCPPAHQRSLRATLRRSTDDLGARERRCLQRLAGLPAGFTRDDAARAWATLPDGPVDVSAVLDRLVDMSLLTVAHDGGRARYRMLWLLRCWATELADACAAAYG
jgi:predicted ATPase/DNA-binding SARP family transcriptional activator